MANEEYDDLDLLLEDDASVDNTQGTKNKEPDTSEGKSKDDISPNFQKVMNNTVHRLNNKPEDVGPKDETNELLDKLFESLNIDGNGEDGKDDEDTMDILLKNILSKEMLYETIKKNQVETEEKIRKFNESKDINTEDAEKSKEHKDNELHLKLFNQLIEIYDSETYDLDKDYVQIRDIMDQLEDNGYGNEMEDIKETDDEMLNKMQQEFNKMIDQGENCEQQ